MSHARMVALLASLLLICSGCCIVELRKDTGDPYVTPVSQWTWADWFCLAVLGCAAYEVGTREHKAVE